MLGVRGGGGGGLCLCDRDDWHAGQPSLARSTALLRGLLCSVLLSSTALLDPRPSHQKRRDRVKVCVGTGADIIHVLSMIAPHTPSPQIFRAAMLPLLVQGGASPWQIVWLAPLYFGVAHLHHGLEYVSRGTSVKRAALMVTAQFAYT